MISGCAAYATIFLMLSLYTADEVSAQRNRPRKGPFHSQVQSPSQRKPNIVLILTDDQDVELGSLNYMPKTLKSIRYQGAEFRHAYVTTPMCCPSRSSLLTGMYVHNHNVYTNNDNCSSTQWQSTHETRSFATYLSNAGYRTGYFGKYLNKYNGSYIPPGWREWGGLIMNSKYYNYSINMNGKKIKHGFDYHKDYYPDLIANDSIAFLRQSKKNSAHKPVMLTMSFPAPHGPEDSAPQFSSMFFNVTSHHTPSYDYAPNPDKQWILQVTNKMQPIHRDFTDLLMTKRLQTLQSVDHAVQRVIDELDALGELDKTYVVYTSDHGYHLGQFGLIKGKSFPFEFDVRVPFLVRGPGVEPGSVVDDIVLNIDLAPTFLHMAGVEVPPHMDGRSVLPLFLNSKRKKLKWIDTFLIESSGRRETPSLDARMKASKYSAAMNAKISTEAPLNASFSHPTFHAMSTTTVRTTPYTIPVQKFYDSAEESSVSNLDDDLDDDDLEADFDGDDLENDDVDEDDEEITNTDTVLARNSQVLPMDNVIRPGVFPNGMNKFDRLAAECMKPEMKKPCKPRQKWYCENESGRWRKHKCKLLPFNPPGFKKCACFTPDGIVYRKIPIQLKTKRQVKLLGRNKRDAEFDNILFDLINDGDIDMSSRMKRNTLEHVETAMKNVRGQITGLQDANSSVLDDRLIRTNLETNRIPETISGCSVIRRGRVNCTDQIYQDRKSWRKSRHEVDNEIQLLKQKLEKLKEIRRHLKHARPIEDEFTSQHNETEWSTTTEFNESSPSTTAREHISTTGYDDGRRRRIRPENDEDSPFKHPRLRPVVNISDFEIHNGELNLTTASPDHYHHRHNRHRHQEVTRVYDMQTEAFEARRKFATSSPKPRVRDDFLSNCHCSDQEPAKPDERELAREAKRRLKEERLRRKLRKQRKKEQLEKECSSERMNCFHHDNDHWKTVPLWTNGPFCFCMNANNNTYSCVRTINSTHNFLYCEFTTGLVTFYNLRIDPFELENRVDQLKSEERSFLHDQLRALIACKGKSCTMNQQHNSVKPRFNNLPIQISHQPRFRKRKFGDDLGNNPTVEEKPGGRRGIRIETKRGGRNSTFFPEAFRQMRRKVRKKKQAND